MKDPNIMSQMANILENAFFGTVTTDVSLSVRYWNRKMESITGIKKEDALNKPIIAILPWLEEEIIKTFVQKDIDIYDAGGKKTTLKITPIRGQSGGFIVLFEDRAEKKTAEVQAQESGSDTKKVKDSAGTANKKTNPLASISPLLQELGKLGKTSPASAELMGKTLEDMDSQISRIGKITKNIGKFLTEIPFVKKPSDLREILNNALASLKIESFKNIELQKKFEEIPLLNVSPGHIQQVFLNIILNALDAMPNGGRLEILTRQTDGFVEIVFQDNGVGMDREVIDKIFDAFFTTKKSGKSVGIGLNVCNSIVKGHNGSINVKSEKGRGTAFVVKFPVKQNV